MQKELGNSILASSALSLEYLVNRPLLEMGIIVRKVYHLFK